MSNVSATLGQVQEITAGIGIQEEIAVSFNGNQAGDVGAVGTYKIFRVTGTVSAQIYAIVENDLAGSSATLAVGVKREDHAGGGSDSSGAFIAATTATLLNTSEIWTTTTPQATFIANTVANFPALVVTRDITVTVATAAITSGRIRFVCLWKPISANSSDRK